MVLAGERKVQLHYVGFWIPPILDNGPFPFSNCIKEPLNSLRGGPVVIPALSCSLRRAEQ